MKRRRDITITEDFRRQEKSGKQNLGWRKGWENLRQNCGHPPQYRHCLSGIALRGEKPDDLATAGEPVSV